MSNEIPKITANIPVDFSFNYDEVGELQINIDIPVLEQRIAETVLLALDSYIKKSTEEDVIEE